jgi:hypothetical protein
MRVREHPRVSNDSRPLVSTSTNHRINRVALRGVSLGETLIAMVILTISVFAALSVNTYCLRAAKGNRHRQIANMLATTQMSLVESVLKINFHAPDSDIQTPKIQSTRYPEFQFIVDDVKYEDPGEDLRHVRVRVFWEEKGADREYALSTTFYNY